MDWLFCTSRRRFPSVGGVGRRTYRICGCRVGCLVGVLLVGGSRMMGLG